MTPLHRLDSSNRTQQTSAMSDPPRRPPPAPKLRDDLELNDDSEDITFYFDHFLEPAESSPPRVSSFSIPSRPTAPESQLPYSFRPTSLGETMTALLLPEKNDEDENDDGESTPRARSPVQSTELLSSEDDLLWSEICISISDDENNDFRRFQQAEKGAGSEEKEDTDIRQGMKDSDHSAIKEGDLRGRLGLRQRRRKQRELPAENLSVARVLGDSTGQAAPKTSFWMGGSDPNATFTESKYRNTDTGSSVLGSPQEAFEANGEFRLADLEDAIKNSHFDTDCGGDGTESARVERSSAASPGSQIQLRNSEAQGRDLLMSSEEFEATLKLKQAAVKKLACEELQQMIAEIYPVTKTIDLRDNYEIEDRQSVSPSPVVSRSSAETCSPDDPKRLRCAIAHTESLTDKSAEALNSYTDSGNTSMVAQKEQELKEANCKLKELQKQLALIENLAQDQARLELTQEGEDEATEKQYAEQQLQPSTLRQAQDALQHARAQLQHYQGQRPTPPPEASDPSSGSVETTSDTSSSPRPRSVYHISEKLPDTAYAPLVRDHCYNHSESPRTSSSDSGTSKERR